MKIQYAKFFTLGTHDIWKYVLKWRYVENTRY